MNVFLKNKSFRQLLINSWISAFGDSVFFLAIISYVSKYEFAPLAVVLLSMSETIPLVLQLLTGVLGDFQKNRIQRWWLISLFKVLLYAILTLFLMFSPFSFFSIVVICLINLVSDSLSYFSASMINAVYIKMLGDDLNQAMGFRQSTMRIVGILANLAGAGLIRILSLESVSFLNLATFFIAFIGVSRIKKPLAEIEKTTKLNRSQMTFSAYVKHLVDSLKVVLKLKPLVLVLSLLATIMAVMNAAPKLTMMILIEKPLATMEVGQVISILSVVISCGSILGSLVSGTLFKQTQLRYLILTCELAIIVLLIGIFKGSILLIFSTLFIASLMIGLLVPRLQAAIFQNIPDDKMGTVGSALSFIDVVIPNLLALSALTISSVISVQQSVLFLLLILLVTYGYIFVRHSYLLGSR